METPLPNPFPKYAPNCDICGTPVLSLEISRHGQCDIAYRQGTDASASSADCLRDCAGFADDIEEQRNLLLEENQKMQQKVATRETIITRLRAICEERRTSIWELRQIISIENKPEVRYPTDKSGGL